MTTGFSALITGSTGYIGGRLAARLKREGWNVHALVRPTSRTERLAQLLGAENIHVHDGSTENLVKIVQRIQPRILFHLASLFVAQHQPSEIVPLIRSNIEFTAQLAEASA